MLKKHLGAALAVILLGSGAASAQRVDVESLSRMPEITGVNMSTEGDFLVAIVADPKNTDRRALATWDISNVDGSKPLAVSSITPSNDRMGFIAANAIKAGKILTVASQPWTGSLSGCGEGNVTGATKTWRYKTFLTDKSIKDFDDIFASGRAIGVSNEMIHCLEIAGDTTIRDLPLDPENVIVVRTDITSGEAKFSKVNLKTGKSDFLFSDDGDFNIGLLDPRDGKILTKGKVEAKGNLEYDGEIYILNPDTKKFDLEQPLTFDYKNRNLVDIAGYDEETGKYFVVTDKFSDHAALYLYDARTNKFDAEPVFAHKDFDVAGVILGTNKSDFGKLLGIAYLAGDQEIYWVDPGMKSIHDGLQNSFKGKHVEILSTTDDRNKVLFVTESPRHAPQYYLLLNKTKLLGIGGERPWIKPEQVGDRQLIYYPARDGMTIPGLLTHAGGLEEGRPGAARDRPPARRTVGARLHGLGLLRLDAVPVDARLRRSAAAVSRLRRLGSQALARRRRRVGPEDAGRQGRRRRLDGEGRLRRQGSHRDLRLLLRRLTQPSPRRFVRAVRSNAPSPARAFRTSPASATTGVRKPPAARLPGPHREGHGPAAEHVQAGDADPDLPRRPGRSRAAVPRHRLLQFGESRPAKRSWSS